MRLGLTGATLIASYASVLLTTLSFSPTAVASLPMHGSYQHSHARRSLELFRAGRRADPENTPTGSASASASDGGSSNEPAPTNTQDDPSPTKTDSDAASKTGILDGAKDAVDSLVNTIIPPTDSPSSESAQPTSDTDGPTNAAPSDPPTKTPDDPTSTAPSNSDSSPTPDPTAPTESAPNQTPNPESTPNNSETMPSTPNIPRPSVSLPSTDSVLPTESSTDEPAPTVTPSDTATDSPSNQPTDIPTQTTDNELPTNSSTDAPTQTYTDPPTDTPTPKPTDPPTESQKPTELPTESLTEKPTDKPTASPSEKPTESLTDSPSDKPTEKPTATLTEKPTDSPTESPTEKPTQKPTETESETEKPTDKPTDSPTNSPTDSPTVSQSDSDTQTLTDSPTDSPTDKPTDTATKTQETETGTQPTGSNSGGSVSEPTPSATQTETEPTISDAPTISEEPTSRAVTRLQTEVTSQTEYQLSNTQNLVVNTEATPTPAPTAIISDPDQVLPTGSVTTTVDFAQNFANLPAFIWPAERLSKDDDRLPGKRLTSIMFKSQLGWQFVASNGDTQVQLFVYMKRLMSEALDINESEIVTFGLQVMVPAPFDGDPKKLKTLFLSYIPEEKVPELQQQVLAQNSPFYKSSGIPKQISEFVDSSFPVDAVSSGQSNGVPGSNSPFPGTATSESGSSSSRRDAIIGVCSAFGVILCSVLGWWAYKSWKQKQDKAIRRMTYTSHAAMSQGGGYGATYNNGGFAPGYQPPRSDSPGSDPFRDQDSLDDYETRRRSFFFAEDSLRGFHVPREEEQGITYSQLMREQQARNGLAPPKRAPIQANTISAPILRESSLNW